MKAIERKIAAAPSLKGVVTSGQAGVAIEISAMPEVEETSTATVAVAKKISVTTYEKKRWLYYLALPMMWLLTFWVMAKKFFYQLFGKSGPQTNTFWFDGLGSSCRRIKEGAASWRALDIIYNHQFKQILSPFGFIDDFWIGMMNAQSVRNRFKLVKQEIRHAIQHFSDQDEVRLMSLAAGSAQGIIEVMAEFKAKGVMVRTMLVDIDQTALSYAEEIAKRYGVADQIEMVKTSVSHVVRLSQDFHPQIIEMLGLLDYIPKEKAVRLIDKIRHSLEPKGIFLTCNICHNPEKYFLKWVINWTMIYRTPIELAEIISMSGFRDYRLVYEPLGIHGLVVASKD